jgi:hypothetical protein
VTKILSDFSPDTGHLVTCRMDVEKATECDRNCASILYSMLTRMEDVMDEWDRITKGVGPTTLTLRAARDCRSA